ncbi:hypothetical protein V8C43DRAFT_191892 [Trichoderma afarasin]
MALHHPTSNSPFKPLVLDCELLARNAPWRYPFRSPFSPSRAKRIPNGSVYYSTLSLCSKAVWNFSILTMGTTSFFLIQSFRLHRILEFFSYEKVYFPLFFFSCSLSCMEWVVDDDPSGQGTLHLACHT